MDDSTKVWIHRNILQIVEKLILTRNSVKSVINTDKLCNKASMQLNAISRLKTFFLERKNGSNYQQFYILKFQLLFSCLAFYPIQGLEK